ncbi:MAG TPA: NACHT domain-containing protein, partial [Anaerolineae bacterium]
FWLLVKKPIFSGLLAALLASTLLGGLYLPDPKSVLIAVLAFGFTFGLLGGLAGGGFACIQHLTLRFTLHYYNQIPWNLSGFLNSNVNRILLPKIGGGYKFFHPLLQEFFVELDERELKSQF